MATDGLDLGALDPASLEALLDPPPDAVTALETCQAFHEHVETFPATQEGYDKFHLGWLGPKYRILEWELFVRDLSAAGHGKPLQYFFASHRKETRPGIPLQLLLPRDVRSKLISKARNVCGESRDRTQEIDEDLESFGALSPALVKLAYPRIHDDLFGLLVKQNQGVPLPALLIEDGELTFYSLLWLLRRVESEAITEWCKAPERKYGVRFAFRSSVPTWASTTCDDLLEQCGLIIVRDGHYQPTMRWWSFQQWLRDTSSSQSLPMKVLTPNNEADQAFASALADCVEHATLGAFMPNDKAFDRVQFFAEQLTPAFLQPFKQLLQRPDTANHPSGSHGNGWRDQDHALFRYARPSFFPWEFLLRSWQPFRTNLLIIPVAWSPLPLGELQRLRPGSPAEGVHEIPHALAYVTIAGRIPKPSDAGYSRWVAGYWALFQSLAGEWLVDQIERDAKRAAESQVAEKLRKEMQPIVEARAVVDRLHGALERILPLVDRLHVRTDALREVARLARSILFEEEEFHDIWQWLPTPPSPGLAEEARNRLKMWNRHLSEWAARRDPEDKSIPLVEQIKTELEARLTEDDLLNALVLAKAVSKDSVPCSLLACRCRPGKLIMQTPENPGSNAEQQAAAFLREFVTVTFQLLREGVEGIFAKIEQRPGGGHVVVLSGVRKWEDLRGKVDACLRGDVPVEYSQGWQSAHRLAVLARGRKGHTISETVGWNLEPDGFISAVMDTRDQTVKGA